MAKLVVSNGILKLFERKFDIIVDCIFGTGLNREVKGTYAEVIDKINKSGAYVVSCDIPSGINADNGKVMGVVHAEKTTKEELGLMMTGSLDLAEAKQKEYGKAKDSRLTEEEWINLKEAKEEKGENDNG